MKILIVDDKEDNIELLRQILEGEHELSSAGNGIEGIRLAKKEHPDLILLDVMMPELDGYAVLEQLKKEKLTDEILVIFLSARYKDTDRIVKGLEMGAFDYLTKPIDEEILLAKVGVASRFKQAKDEVKSQKAALEEKINELITTQEALSELNLTLDQQNRELEEKNRELERFNKLFVDRELRMRELKAQVKRLEKENPLA